jgi:hypothetical protein
MIMEGGKYSHATAKTLRIISNGFSIGVGKGISLWSGGGHFFTLGSFRKYDIFPSIFGD